MTVVSNAYPNAIIDIISGQICSKIANLFRDCAALAPMADTTPNITARATKHFCAKCAS